MVTPIALTCLSLGLGGSEAAYEEPPDAGDYSELAEPGDGYAPAEYDAGEDPACDDDTCDEWTSAAMPGVSLASFSPAGLGTTYTGAGIQLVPFAWSHDDGDGPGRGLMLAQASLLRSPDDPHSIGLFEMGLSLSFERAPGRRFFIPFWGFSFGGLAHPELEAGGFAHGNVGVHLLFFRHVVLDVQGGYNYPFRHIDTWRGPRFALSLRSAAW